jgi:hypothetical protein
MTDTADFAHVPLEERLDRDHPDGLALEGGDDTDLLDTVYANPGPVVGEEQLA